MASKNNIFIEKARQIHNDKYDYSKVNYVNSRTKVCIICPEHGEFWQTPNTHLKGSKCPKCANIQNGDRIRDNAESFIKNPNNDVYTDIDHIDGNSENNSENNLRLICPNCHSLTATYRGANRGHGRNITWSIKSKDKSAT